MPVRGSLPVTVAAHGTEDAACRVARRRARAIPRPRRRLPAPPPRRPRPGGATAAACGPGPPGPAAPAAGHQAGVRPGPPAALASARAMLVTSAAGTLPSRPGRAASPVSSARQSAHRARWRSTAPRSAGADRTQDVDTQRPSDLAALPGTSHGAYPGPPRSRGPSSIARLAPIPVITPRPALTVHQARRERERLPGWP